MTGSSHTVNSQHFKAYCIENSFKTKFPRYAEYQSSTFLHLPQQFPFPAEPSGPVFTHKAITDKVLEITEESKGKIIVINCDVTL